MDNIFYNNFSHQLISSYYDYKQNKSFNILLKNNRLLYLGFILIILAILLIPIIN